MIVYGARTLFFEVLMIPCLRDPASLEMRSELTRQQCQCSLLESWGDILVVFQHVLVWASRTGVGGTFVAGRTTRVSSCFEFRSKTHGWPVTEAGLGIAWTML
jgi:hypothetical protein